MKKYLLVLILATFIVPSIVFASWWNPFSWKIFKKSPEIKIEQPIVIPISSPVEKIQEPKKIVPTTSIKKNTIKTEPVVQKVENTDLKIEKCKANKETYYNTAILKLNQGIDSKLKEVFASLDQQAKDTANKIYAQAEINTSRITNDQTLTASSKLSLIQQYNDDAESKVDKLYKEQQTFWQNQKQEIENGKQRGIEKINILLGEEYTKCLAN